MNCFQTLLTIFNLRRYSAVHRATTNGMDRGGGEFGADIINRPGVVSGGRMHVVGGAERVGRAVQVVPGYNLGDRAWFQPLQLKYDEALSNSAFSFKLRRYMSETSTVQFTQIAEGNVSLGLRIPIHVVLPRLYCCPSVQAGASTRLLLSSN